MLKIFLINLILLIYKIIKIKKYILLNYLFLVYLNYKKNNIKY